MNKILEMISKKLLSFRRLFLASMILSDAKHIQKIIERRFSTLSKGAQKICVLLLKQNISLAHCILLLCRKKQLSEAQILTRSLLETSAYVLFFAEKDHEERVELYRHSISLSMKVSVDEFNAAVPEGCEKADVAFYDNAEKEALKYFRDKHGKDTEKKDIKRKYTLDPRKAANMLSGDVKRIYNTLYTKFYRPVSALSHGQDPINSFKFIDGKNKKTQKRLHNELRVVIQTVCILLFYDLMYVDKLLDLKQTTRMDSMDKKTKAIIELLKRDD